MPCSKTWNEMKISKSLTHRPMSHFVMASTHSELPHPIYPALEQRSRIRYRWDQENVFLFRAQAKWLWSQCCADWSEMERIQIGTGIRWWASALIFKEAIAAEMKIMSDTHSHPNVLRYSLQDPEHKKLNVDYVGKWVFDSLLICRPFIVDMTGDSLISGHDSMCMRTIGLQLQSRLRQNVSDSECCKRWRTNVAAPGCIARSDDQLHSLYSNLLLPPSSILKFLPSKPCVFSVQWFEIFRLQFTLALLPLTMSCTD